MIWKKMMIFRNLILDLAFLSNIIIFCRNLINRRWCISHLHVCVCVFTYYETPCPVPRATFFSTLRCAVEPTNTSVSGAVRSFLGWTCIRDKRPVPRPAWFWAFISAQGRWGCSGSPARLGAPGTLALSSRTECLECYHSICLQADSGGHKF